MKGKRKMPQDGTDDFPEYFDWSEELKVRRSLGSIVSNKGYF